VNAWPWIVGYSIGSIPFAWLIVRAMAGLDLRKAGSGNVGAANALRVSGWQTGIAVALLDLAKGSAAVGLVAAGGGDLAARAAGGLAAVAGHVFPIWLRFHGGKGVATAAGVFAALTPLSTVVAAVVFGIVLVATRIVSLASLCGTLALAACATLQAAAAPVLGAVYAAAGLILWRHRANIVRIARRTERRLGRRRGADSAAR
jgi:glycerol-3-phosphate acyltransferase PlsY